MEDIRFYGWDTIRYYWFVIQNHFSGWSWQISVAYSIVFCCSVALILLGLVFAFRVQRRNRRNKHQALIADKYTETIKQILLSDNMPASSMIELLKKCDGKDEDGQAAEILPVEGRDQILQAEINGQITAARVDCRLQSRKGRG